MTNNFLFSLKLSLKLFANNLSFSIHINFLGDVFKISIVKLPVPGPISIISLFLSDESDKIFFIIFLSIKKFY